ncbi:hypothetical protein NL676_010540 [Syzygium grande]|nr:hypothetical protein NL676_010540 [Syzygium grande]
MNTKPEIALRLEKKQVEARFNRYLPSKDTSAATLRLPFAFKAPPLFHFSEIIGFQNRSSNPRGRFDGRVLLLQNDDPRNTRKPRLPKKSHAFSSREDTATKAAVGNREKKREEAIALKKNSKPQPREVAPPLPLRRRARQAVAGSPLSSPLRIPVL